MEGIAIDMNTALGLSFSTGAQRTCARSRLYDLILIRTFFLICKSDFLTLKVWAIK